MICTFIFLLADGIKVKITLLVELVDDQNPRIIQQYDGYLNIISRTRDAQGNALAYFAVGNDLHKEYHYLFISPDGEKHFRHFLRASRCTDKNNTMDWLLWQFRVQCFIDIA